MTYLLKQEVRILAQYDGSLKFDTNIDSKGFNSGVKNISSSFNGILKTLKLLIVQRKPKNTKMP